MKSWLLVFVCLLVSFAFVTAQEADSLLLADFEVEEEGIAPFNGTIGDGFVQSNWSPDITGESDGVLEVTIDGALGQKAGFRDENFEIVVDGDTATALVAYVWLPDDLEPGEGSGVQLFLMDKTAWNWQSSWQALDQIELGVWVRLVFDITSRFETLENWDITNGFHAGIEFALPTGSDYFGSYFADNLYLLGVSNTQTSVASDEPKQPADFELEQNYPNPFNPVTRIYYTLPASQPVTLQVYDVSGRLVQTLVQDEQQPAGRHMHQFDASNLSSGIYFYQISTPTFFDSRKMTVVK